MGKKYMDTKKGSLEQSILDVWKEAAEELPVQPQTKHGSGEHAFEVGKLPLARLKKHCHSQKKILTNF